MVGGRVVVADIRKQGGGVVAGVERIGGLGWERLGGIVDTGLDPEASFRQGAEGRVVRSSVAVAVGRVGCPFVAGGVAWLVPGASLGPVEFREAEGARAVPVTCAGEDHRPEAFPGADGEDASPDPAAEYL